MAALRTHRMRRGNLAYVRHGRRRSFVLPILPTPLSVLEPLFEGRPVGVVFALEDLAIGHGCAFEVRGIFSQLILSPSFSPPQVGTAQVGTEQVGLPHQVGTAQIGTTQQGLSQVGTAEVRIEPRGAAQGSLFQVGSFENHNSVLFLKQTAFPQELYDDSLLVGKVMDSL